MSDDEYPESIVTGLMRRGGRALLVHRAPDRRWYPDCWDLPGGHVEDGETQAEALRRELGEELGVTATVAGPAYAAFSGATFHLSVWVVDAWEGEPVNAEPAEHDAIAWTSPDEARTLRLAHPELAALLRQALREPGQ